MATREQWAQARSEASEVFWTHANQGVGGSPRQSVTAQQDGLMAALDAYGAALSLTVEEVVPTVNPEVVDALHRLNDQRAPGSQLDDAEIVALAAEIDKAVEARIARCPAVLTVKGERFPCDWPGPIPHDGWAHQSHKAEALWTGSEVRP